MITSLKIIYSVVNVFKDSMSLKSYIYNGKYLADYFSDLNKKAVFRIKMV